MIQVSQTAIEDLLHDSLEIRLRTLDQIDAKIQRAFAHQESVDFKADFLCKQLIRWFKYIPVQKPQTVLNLLKLLLDSKYYAEIKQSLGIKRLWYATIKVRKILSSTNRHDINSLQIIDYILEKLNNANRNSDDEIFENVEALTLSDKCNESEKNEPEKLTCSKSEENDIGYLSCVTNPHVRADECEEPWSKPNVTDFNTMKLLAEILQDPLQLKQEIDDVLCRLNLVIWDYPLEYLLQAPNLFIHMMQLYDILEIIHKFEDVFYTVFIFLKYFKKQIKLRSKTTACAPRNDDNTSMAKVQIKIEVVLRIILEKNIEQLQKKPTNKKDRSLILAIIFETIELHKIFKFQMNLKQLNNIFETTSVIRNNISTSKDINYTTQRIEYTLLVLMQLYIIETDYLVGNLSKFDFTCSEHIVDDFSIQYYFANNYNRFKKLVCDISLKMKNKFNTLDTLDEAMNLTLRVLNSPTSMNYIELIENSTQMISILEKVESLKLTEHLFDAVVYCNCLYVEDLKLRKQSEDLITNLLELKSSIVRELICKKFARIVKKHFRCLMCKEKFCNSISNIQLLEKHITGVPINSQILSIIAYMSFEYEINLEIKQNCEDILVFILKSNVFLNEKCNNYWEIVIPVLPILQCCTYSTKILDILLSIFDPDNNNGLPFVDKLKGNIGLLLNPNLMIRSEALTRIIYMINVSKTTTEYVPNLTEIGDLLPNDICLLFSPVEFNNIFIHETNIDLKTLHEILNLLTLSSIEPVVRKTIFTQLNVLCKNWENVIAFSKEGAYYPVLQALEQSLQRSSYGDSMETLIPIVGILSKILFYDTELRNKLCNTSNIFILIMRVLFLNISNEQLRNDATICLFQLLFTNYMVVKLGQGYVIEMPQIFQNIHLPIKCNYINCKIRSGNKFYISDSNEDNNEYWRMMIAQKVCDIHNIQIDKSYLRDQQTFHDFKIELHLTKRDLCIMNTTNPIYNVEHFVNIFKNTPDHAVLGNAIAALKLQILINYFDVDIKKQTVSDFCDIITRYLQIVPKSQKEFVIYENLLELFDNSITHIEKIQSFPSALIHVNEMKRAFLLLLKNPDVELRMFSKLCELFSKIVILDSNFDIDKYFELILKMMKEHLKCRNLLHCRSIFIVLRSLGCHTSRIDETNLIKYIKHLVFFSSVLKSYTLTGAQWQRDCLIIISQLFNELMMKNENAILDSPSLKYFSSMCGHQDAVVRSLAWSILGQYVQMNLIPKQKDKNFFETLSYLPGGFLACCISTFMDITESCLTRQLSGSVFELLARHYSNSFNIQELLNQHKFLETFFDSLNVCYVNTLENDNNIVIKKSSYADLNNDNVIPWELVSCFCKIIGYVILKLDPKLKTKMNVKNIMGKLLEFIKLDVCNENKDYYKMCGDICKLCTFCHEEYYNLIKKTICRDNVWLTNFSKLLLNINPDNKVKESLFEFLLVLLKDAYAYSCICDFFENNYESVTKCFMQILLCDSIQINLMKNCLMTLNIMLIKSQQNTACNVHVSFIKILEMQIDANDVQSVNTKNEKSKSKDDILQVNINVDESMHTYINYLEYMQNGSSLTTGAEYIFIELVHKFISLYMITKCRFEESKPTTLLTLYCESISLLLKTSERVQEIAEKIQFMKHLLNILETFFAALNPSSSIAFVRRYGELRKKSILSHFILIYNIIFHWISASTIIIDSVNIIKRLSKVLFETWSWFIYSAELKVLVLNICAFLSERSFGICKMFSTVISPMKISLLQLVAKSVTSQTNGIKTSSKIYDTMVKLNIRILTNCCACLEGRLTILKMDILHVFDNLYPYNPKLPKIKIDILVHWLSFWELFSRYNEGANAKNIHLLSTIINCSDALSIERLLSLMILRNMCFLPMNRSILLSSIDFITVVDNILCLSPNISEEKSCEEQLIVCVAFWKLISENAKNKALIRGTKLCKHFRSLLDQISIINANKLENIYYGNDLRNVLHIIMDLLDR